MKFKPCSGGFTGSTQPLQVGWLIQRGSVEQGLLSRPWKGDDVRAPGGDTLRTASWKDPWGAVAGHTPVTRAGLCTVPLFHASVTRAWWLCVPWGCPRGVKSRAELAAPGRSCFCNTHRFSVCAVNKNTILPLERATVISHTPNAVARALGLAVLEEGAHSETAPSVRFSQELESSLVS